MTVSDLAWIVPIAALAIATAYRIGHSNGWKDGWRAIVLSPATGHTTGHTADLAGNNKPPEPE